jgi:hypothetical protein
MSASILERIEAHQLRILAGQEVIVGQIGGLVTRVNDHEVRIGGLAGRANDHEARIVELECAEGGAADQRLDALEKRQVRQGRRLRVLLWLFPIACMVSALAGAWVALRL